MANDQGNIMPLSEMGLNESEIQMAAAAWIALKDPGVPDYQMVASLCGLAKKTISNRFPTLNKKLRELAVSGPSTASSPAAPQTTAATPRKRKAEKEGADGGKIPKRGRTPKKAAALNQPVKVEEEFEGRMTSRTMPSRPVSESLF